ncbi:MAG: hypothetical protein J6P16_06650 [Eubacterium sp.]|nr:hypothetical protein [Eubacterium sp.]
MKAWLIYDPEGADRNSDYIKYHFELGKKYGIEFELIYAGSYHDLPCRGGVSDHKKGMSDFAPKFAPDPAPEFALVRTINPDINKYLEDNGIRAYNNYRVSYITNHKGRCIDYVAECTDVPVIPTETITRTGAVSPELIIKKHPGYVIKPASSHGGKNVMRIPADAPCGQLLDSVEVILGHDDLILQPFIEGPTDERGRRIAADVRVYVIGRQIIAAVKRQITVGSGSEFRANASLGADVESYNLSAHEISLVEKITDKFDFGMVGIDFILDKNNDFIFSEIEDVVGARMLYKTHPDIDILDKYIRHILKTLTG